MLYRSCKPLFGRFKAQTTSTKTPALASPTQAETASGVPPTDLRISAGSSRMKKNELAIFYVNFIEFLFFGEEHVQCPSSSSTVYFSFMMTSHLMLTISAPPDLMFFL
jgi:hypothetical protein